MTTTAIEMANERGISPKRFRAELRKAAECQPEIFKFHHHRDPWIAEVESKEYKAMLTVLESLDRSA